MFTMTEAQYEKAARELCRQRGQNPEEQDDKGVPRWRWALVEVRNFFELCNAVERGMAA